MLTRVTEIIDDKYEFCPIDLCTLSFDRNKIRKAQDEFAIPWTNYPVLLQGQYRRTDFNAKSISCIGRDIIILNSQIRLESYSSFMIFEERIDFFFSLYFDGKEENTNTVLIKLETNRQ